MDELLTFNELPSAVNMRMITGWRQWADAGSVSSALPEYIIEQTGARKIGEIRSDDFYLFQIPGAHHLLRPIVQFEDGFSQSLEQRRNEFYFAGDEANGLIIFLGDEPHLAVDRYAGALFSAVDLLGVSRIVGLAGVYGPVPYDRERQISCIYSLPEMRKELEEYAVGFSDYEGGASIGSYLVSKSKDENLPYLIFYAFAPAYDFNANELMTQGIRLENDYKAWYDIMRRVNRLLQLNLNLRDLEARSAELIDVIDKRIGELEEEMPQLGIREYLSQVEEQFTEMQFVKLDEVWEDELKNLFGEDSENS
ncbi:MAG: PAC2 family protein [Candidatus Promineifilaceae bacterium]